MMTHFYFAPIAVVTLGSWGSKAKSLVAEIGRHITLKCGDSRLVRSWCRGWLLLSSGATLIVS